MKFNDIKDDVDAEIAWIIGLATKFESKTHLKKTRPGIYNRLLKLHPEILEAAFPFLYDPLEKKQQILERAKSGAKRPNKSSRNPEERKLAISFGGYINSKSDTYDEEFTKQIKKLRPDWFDGKLGASYRKMISLMPKTVQFKEGQEWKGTHTKYIFVDDDFGEFASKVDNLMGRSWKMGLTGHPERAAKRRGESKSKKVKNLVTGEVFTSLFEAIKQYGMGHSGLSNHLCGKTKTFAGDKWAYCDEKGRVLK